MTITQALVLGVIQGITEFLPISSSGHLIFVPVIFGWEDQGLAFDVVVHLGSLVAVVYYFRHKLWNLRTGVIASVIACFTKQKKKDLRSLIVLSMIPALVVGASFELFAIEIRSPFVVAMSLIFWGMVLMFADYANRQNQRSLTSVSRTDAIRIGIAQAIALVPGTSRSGITMTAGLFSGFTRTAAAEFSFLMSIPIIAIAGTVKVLQLITSGASVDVAPIVVGFIAAAGSGLLAIWGLMKIVEKWSFVPFGVYRILVGLAILLWIV